MNPLKRSLSLEPIEDRALPSVTFFTFHPSTQQDDVRVARPANQDRPVVRLTVVPVVAEYHGRLYEVDEIFIQYQRYGGESLSWSNPGSGDSIIDSSGSRGSSGGTNTGGDSTSSDSATRSAGGHTVAKSQSGTPVTDQNFVEHNISALSSQSDANVAARVESAAAQPVAQQVQSAQTQVVLAASSTASNTHAAYQFLDAGDVPASRASAPDALPGAPESAEPPPAMPAPADAPGHASVDEAPTIPALQVPSPVAGVLPFNPIALGSAASTFLDRVSDLSPDWPSSMPQFEDYLWTAAAAVTAVGAVGAGLRRPGERSDNRRSKLDSVLVEWESKNAGRVG